jgi:ABC-type uncharacterized transport system auxiliary subunit
VRFTQEIGVRKYQFEGRSPCSASDGEAAAQALSRAFDYVAKGIVSWAAAAVAR